MKPAFNPYLPSYEYVPDGEPRVFDGRLYVYGSHDRFGGPDFCVNDYVCWSAPENAPGDWRCEGIIYRANQDRRNPKGKMHMCAPDCVQGPDGRYYLYYQLHELTCTSVAVADRPAGPFEFYGYVQHPDGTPWGEKKGDSFAFDPGVLTDDDGKVYVYVGFAPDGFLKTVFRLRGTRVDGAVCLELGPDMKTVTGRENPVIPGHKAAQGTPFEGHAFFEASSPRRIGNRYYLVYSSERSHELCYAVSDYPDRDFRYGGTIISNGDLDYQGRTEADNYTGNTHGGMVCLNGQWHIFYHRHTNLQKCARQGCAEKIEILPDGCIPQVEMTSCGLNNGPLPGKGNYEARIACNLSSRRGTFPYLKVHEKNRNGIHPYFSQSGPDREQDGDQYIANMTDGSSAGFKYFRFDGSEHEIRIRLRSRGEGTVQILTGRGSTPAAEIPVSPAEKDSDFVSAFSAEVGVDSLLFRYCGNGSIDFLSFTIV